MINPLARSAVTTSIASHPPAGGGSFGIGTSMVTRTAEWIAQHVVLTARSGLPCGRGSDCAADPRDRHDLPLGCGVDQIRPVRNKVIPWAIPLAASRCQDGLVSMAASIALRMLPVSISTSGTVVRFNPARSLRNTIPPVPS